ncbi:leucine-rich repeat receptor-like protein kinase IMK2 [Hibiscus syriacus]|uniref:Leucine-rich repeat receptor-like protein kinase IMK2 n=1 Tax=Hibiscus syriacus TaxID=106335 RepID=A0A6A2Y1Z9_HIBSY|nr:leucine-rich repeat receptor-like protein kinase IMK2 [Hibiscus syriacus]
MFFQCCQYPRNMVVKCMHLDTVRRVRTEKKGVVRSNRKGIESNVHNAVSTVKCARLQVASQAWDGVIVTAADFQALQAFKQELIDPKGLLRSWNDSGYGACSGGWVGIKCAGGQVIVIQLPWKGLGSCPLLQTLDLSNNSLNSLANSTKFYRLNLSFNSFSGSIPKDSFYKFQYLTLDQNLLSGTIPASLVKLSELQELSLHCPKSSIQAPLLETFSYVDIPNRLHMPFPAPSQNFPSSPSEESSTKHIILIAAGILLIVLFVLCCILICYLIRKRATLKAKDGQTTTRAAAAAGGKGTPPPSAGEVEAGENGGKLVHFDGSMVFSADDLLCATAEIMGKSTYGTVYKTTFEDGNQVTVLGKIRHPNLLALMAYYLGPIGEKLLVFDYMPKGSPSTFLHARGPKTPIDWPTRMRIAKGVTRGLLCLHTQENIIHGNLTSSNVLLDDETRAKIEDYGISLLMTAAANENIIAAPGALGYRALELSKLKKTNTKTDVYILGVIILELLTGKSPGEAMNDMDLPQWAASVVKEEWTKKSGQTKCLMWS